MSIQRHRYKSCLVVITIRYFLGPVPIVSLIIYNNIQYGKVTNAALVFGCV